MFRRRQALDSVGYYDSVRKAADTEYFLRLVLDAPESSIEISKPLAFVRMSNSSLSRTDFSPGRIDLLVIRYPLVLQFPPSTPTNVDVGRAIIVTDPLPTNRDGSDRRYTIPVCEQAVFDLFGVIPYWVPQSPLARRALEPIVDSDRLVDFEMPGILDFSAWTTPRGRFRSDRPVVGRLSRNSKTSWPTTADDILEAYPGGDEFDIRIMGGASSAAAALGTRGIPPHWLVYEYDEIPRRLFLNQLDFFVYLRQPNCGEVFSRVALEAIATGCVTVLAPKWRPVFGDGAIYCSAEAVRDTVRQYWKDPDAYRAQVARGYAFVRDRFSYDSYADRVEALLGRRAPQDSTAATAGNQA